MSAPYAGAKISLISKSRIRYEGILFSIDPEKSTVALKNVRSFGTEDRRPEATIGPSSEVWECIIFRGSDIDDLHVCEAPQTAMPADPAIVSMPPTMGYPGYPPNYPYPYGGYYPPPYGYHPAYPAPPGAAAFPPGVAAPAPPHAGENARQPALDTAAAFTDPSAAAAAPAASFSPFGGSNPLIITPAKESSDAAAPRKEAQPAPQPASTPATATTPAPNTTLPSSSPSASPSPASTPASPSPSPSPAAPSTPSSKAPLLASTAGPASTSTPPSSSPAPQAASGARKPHYGADHERAETAVAAAAPAPAATGDILQPFDFAASNALWEKPKQVESSPAKAYVKTSFFDSISCETTDRQVNPGRPPSLQEQRALDSETFGSVAVQDRERTNRQSRYHHPRGGRGGRGSRYHRGGSSRGGYSDHGSRPPRTDRTE